VEEGGLIRHAESKFPTIENGRFGARFSLLTIAAE
jgi:hypothetical protein